MSLAEHSEKLPLFVAIYERGTIRKAAETLNMTQPPLSFALKKLEAALNQQLFTRSQKGMAPTQAGEALYRFSKKYLREMGQIEDEFNDPTDIMSGTLLVGTYDSIARYFWPEIVKEVKVRYPKLELELYCGRTSLLTERVLNREIDFAIMVEPPRISDFVLSQIYSDQYGCFRSKLDTDIDHNVLMYVGRSTAGEGRTLDDWIQDSHLDAMKPFRLDSFEVCREFIKKGLGIGILPLKVAQQDLNEGTIEQVTIGPNKKISAGDETFGEHGFFNCYLRDNRQVAKIRTLSQMIKDVLNHSSKAN